MYPSSAVLGSGRRRSFARKRARGLLRRLALCLPCCVDSPLHSSLCSHSARLLIGPLPASHSCFFPRRHTVHDCKRAARPPSAAECASLSRNSAPQPVVPVVLLARSHLRVKGHCQTHGRCRQAPHAATRTPEFCVDKYSSRAVHGRGTLRVVLSRVASGTGRQAARLRAAPLPAFVLLRWLCSVPRPVVLAGTPALLPSVQTWTTASERRKRQCVQCGPAAHGHRRGGSRTQARRLTDSGAAARLSSLAGADVCDD